MRLAACQVARLADQVAQALQLQSGHAVARRDRAVVARFRTQYQRFMVVAGEEEATISRVLELLEHEVGQCAGEAQVGGAQQVALHDFEHAPSRERVVIEIGIEVRAADRVGGQQAAVAPQRRTNEVERAPRRLGPTRFAEYPRREGHAVDRQRVPGGQHLVVAARPHARLAQREQARAGAGDQRLAFGRRARPSRSATSANGTAACRCQAWPSKFGAASSP